MRWEVCSVNTGGCQAAMLPSSLRHFALTYCCGGEADGSAECVLVTGGVVSRKKIREGHATITTEQPNDKIFQFRLSSRVSPEHPDAGKGTRTAERTDISIDDLTCSPPAIKPSALLQRFFHTATFHAPSRSVILCGGLLGNGEQISAELAQYSPFDQSVRQLGPFSGDVPCPRFAHAASIAGNRLFIFGGENDHRKLLKDLCVLKHGHQHVDFHRHRVVCGAVAISPVLLRTRRRRNWECLERQWGLQPLSQWDQYEPQAAVWKVAGPARACPQQSAVDATPTPHRCATRLCVRSVRRPLSFGDVFRRERNRSNGYPCEWRRLGLDVAGPFSPHYQRSVLLTKPPLWSGWHNDGTGLYVLGVLRTLPCNRHVFEKLKG